MLMFNKLLYDQKVTNLITLILPLYLFFISRRGGDTRHIFSLILIAIVIIQMVITKKNKIKEYKYLYITGIIYIIFVSLSYFKTIDRVEKTSEFLNIFLYSTSFFLIVLNAKFKENIYKYFIPIITIFSFDGIYRGIKELPVYFKNSTWYRVTGGSYTTVYAIEIGLYIIIGIICFIYYKNNKVKIFYFVYAVINILLMFSTQSRTLAVMLPLTLVIMIFIKNKKYGLISFGGIIILGLFLFGNIDKIPVLRRLNSVATIKNVEKDARITILKRAIEIEKEIFPGNLGFYAYKTSDISIVPGEKNPHFHNVITETLLTQGPISLIFYLIFNLLIFKELIKKFLYLNSDNSMKIIYAIALASFVFSSLAGMVESTFYFSKSTLLMYTILTIAFSKDNDKL